ncbi:MULTISPECIES: VanZ family protein [Salinibaculum]|uniref:VanZ family protein n=1 Tax=Salinibaculum TaxID=2732368 RepID=UPI0030D26007
MPSFRVGQRARWGLVAVVAAAILVAAVVRPGDAGPTLGPLGVLGLDKYLHALAFAALAATLAAALATSSVERLLVVVVLVSVGYGLLVELLQLPLAYRSFSLLDLAADAVGAVLVALLWRGGQWLRRPDAATATE